ncbi:SseB family protein [Streptomyces griseochromogenes]|uniref:SseB family protein n=1 Tax=Streptomyces griseochromogenes TaxID=68214 RepID=UPI0037A5B2CA
MDETEIQPPRSALADIAARTVLYAGHEPALAAEEASAPPGAAPSAAANPTPEAPPPPAGATRLPDHRREFHARLGEFRRRRVLVPHGESGDALTVETHGARWLLAFTDEAALARYARARGEADRTWRYRTVWGAAVLDAGVPAVAEAGLPCGVLVDAGDGERGLVLPPVAGIVPEAVAVTGRERDEATESGTP